MRLCRVMALWSVSIAVLGGLAVLQVSAGRDPRGPLLCALSLWLLSPAGYALVGALIGRRARGMTALSGAILSGFPIVNAWSLAAVLSTVSKHERAHVHLAPPLVFVFGLVSATLACFLSNLTTDPQLSRNISAVALFFVACAPPLARALGLLTVRYPRTTTPRTVWRTLAP